MKQIQVIFSFIFIILGIVIITFSNILEEVIPKLGFAIFKSEGSGTYTPSDYQLNLELNYWIGILCVLSGLAYLISRMNLIQKYKNDIKSRNQEFDDRDKDD